MRVPLGLPPLPLAPRLAMLAPLLSLVLLQPFLRCLVPLRLPPLHLSPSLITLLMILLLLVLLILTLPVLRLRFLHLCLTARAEVRRMYQYLVDLFPQAAGSSQAPLPPRALFEEFFAALSSPHQPVFLSWFERIRSTLSETDTHIVNLLASGRPESSLLPPRQAQYSVGGGSSLGSTAPLNPSLLAMLERLLRPSLHLGLMVREAALLESSSRALSESQSHAMWLLSGLLGFVHLQGFAPLFNTLVSSLSKCLAHQATILASHTAFVGLKRRQFYLSHLPVYSLTSISVPCWLLPLFVRTLCSWSPTSHACCLTLRPLPPSGLSRLWLMSPPTALGPRRRRFSPARSPARSSPSRRRRRDSGSPSRSSKRVRIDSPAPSSALKPPNKGFRR